MKKWVCKLCIMVGVAYLLTGCNKVDTMQVMPELYLNTPTTTISEKYNEDVETENTEYDILTDVLSDVIIVEDNVDKASKRLAQFHKRLNSSNITMSVKQLYTTNGADVTERYIDAYYYADCANVHYTDDKVDVGLIVMGEDSYLLDSVSKIAYSVATCDIKYANSSALLSMFSTQDGAYMGTCEQKVSDIVLSCDIYYVNNVVYKMCYTQDSDTLIMTIRIDKDSECCNIFETLTTVEDMRIFEIPDDYIYLRYEDYLEVRHGENDKFALFII